MAKEKRKLDRPGQTLVGQGRPKRPLAPRNVSVQMLDTTSERHRLAERYKKDGQHMFFGDRTKVKEYVEVGYQPVLEDGQQVHHKGDPLFFIDKKTADARRAASEIESVSILEQARSGELAGNVIMDESGEAHRVSVKDSID